MSSEQGTRLMKSLSIIAYQFSPQCAQKQQTCHDAHLWEDDMWCHLSWRCHQIKTLYTLLVLCLRIPGEFSLQRPVTQSFSSVYTWTNGWVTNLEAGDLRCSHAHYDIAVMWVLILVYHLPVSMLCCMHICMYIRFYGPWYKNNVLA